MVPQDQRSEPADARIEQAMSTLDAHKIRQFLAEWSAEIRTDRAINSLRRCRIDLLQEEIERLRKDLDINLAA